MSTGEAGGDQAVQRRTMLKAAAAAGVGAVTWSAPRIESLGFMPAAAATPCTILSPANQDKNSNASESGVYCATSSINNYTCCNKDENGAIDFGNSGNSPDEWRFVNPHPGCNEIVVRLVPTDCGPSTNPNLARMATVISSTSGNCQCEVLQAELLHSSGRQFIKALNNGPSACLLGGVDASMNCEDPDLAAAGSSARLAVRIICQFGNPGCVPVNPN